MINHRELMASILCKIIPSNRTCNKMSLGVCSTLLPHFSAVQSRVIFISQTLELVDVKLLYVFLDHLISGAHLYIQYIYMYNYIILSFCATPTYRNLPQQAGPGIKCQLVNWSSDALATGFGVDSGVHIGVVIAAPVGWYEQCSFHPGWLSDIGDYTTQLYGDYNKII